MRLFKPQILVTSVLHLFNKTLQRCRVRRAADTLGSGSKTTCKLLIKLIFVIAKNFEHRCFVWPCAILFLCEMHLMVIAAAEDVLKCLKIVSM